MNSATPEQRTEVIYALYKAWEAAIAEVGDISLIELLSLNNKFTETELIDNLMDCYQGEYEWTNFNKEDLEAEYHAKFKKDVVEGKSWAKIVETYNMNRADQRHCRFLIEDDIDARVKEVSEIQKASRTIEVLEALIKDLKEKV